MTTQDETKDSERQAVAKIAHIVLLIEAHRAALDMKRDHFAPHILRDLDGEGFDLEGFDPAAAGVLVMAALADDIEEHVHEMPLAVLVRTDWHALGAEDDKPTHYQILLSTGGPATRMVGELSQYGEPMTASIEHQDWFTPWQRYGVTVEIEAVLVAFAQFFYYGD